MSDRRPQSPSRIGFRRTEAMRFAVPIILTALGGGPAAAAVACKPAVTPQKVLISEPSGSQRLWTAVLAVDARTCASTSGSFEIDFVRQKETAPDLQFTERFTWRPGTIEVSIDIWIDETITDFRVGFVAPCVCPEPPF